MRAENVNTQSPSVDVARRGQLRALRAGMRQLWGYMPPDTAKLERLALAELFMFDDDDEFGAVLSHRELGELGGYSEATSYRTIAALERKGHIASKPQFRDDEDHSQMANSYAVLAFANFRLEPVEAREADPPVKMMGGLGKVTNQQKEISEEIVVPPAPPVDDPTPEDRAALAAAVREIDFPKRAELPDPEPGSALAAVCERWGWHAYGDVLSAMQHREVLARPELVPEALRALLKRPLGWVGVPGAYFFGTHRIMAKTPGPGLRSTRPPDAPMARRRVLMDLRDACPAGDRYNQLNLEIHLLSRQIVLQRANTS